MSRVTVRRLAALAWLAALSASGEAQQLTLQATVDRTTVRQNESFTYVLQAEGQVRGEPVWDPLEGSFEILDRSRTTQIQILNGQAVQTAEWALQLMPRQAGRLRLPPIELAGVASNAVEIEVLPPRPGAATGDIFLEAEVTPAEAYVQSQVVFTLQVFRGVSIGRATLTAPQVIGVEAIVEQLGEDGEYQTVRDGRSFFVRERRYAIFPQQSGVLTIEPVTFEALVMTSNGFSSVRRFRSDALHVMVGGIVPPPPEYPNATWLPASELTLSESWSERPEALTVGVPQTRTLTVRARGLLETQLPELPAAEVQGIRQYGDRPALERDVDADGLVATRTERFAIIAQTPGQARLAGIELPWWNVETERWEVARLPPRRLDVLPSSETPAAQPGSASRPAAAEPPPDERGSSAPPWRLLSGALLAAWLLTLLAWWRSRRGGATPPPAAEPAAPPRRGRNRQLLHRLRAACRANDPGRARRLLLEWAMLRFPEPAPRSLGALAARLPADVADEIRALEASLYGPNAAEAWSGERLEAALGRVDSVARPAAGAAAEELLPLYR